MRAFPGPKRRGAVLVESAIIYPLLFLLLFGLIVGGLTVFRYQQVAMLSREAARFAAVRGDDWSKETKQPSPTAAEIAQQVVVPMSAGMEPEQLTVQVQWVCPATGQVIDWDSSRKSAVTLNAQNNPVTNRVRVTVTYQWN